MNLDQWRQVQATEPATRNQVGAIRDEFDRLGFGEADRAERLAISAALAGCEQLRSTRDLTIGQAGQLYRTLLDISDRGELATAATLGDQDQAAEDGDDQDQAAEAGDDQNQGVEDGERAAGPTLSEALMRLILACLTWQEITGRRAADEPGAGGPGD